MVLFRVCCTIYSGSIANILLHTMMGIYDGTFTFPVLRGEDVYQISFGEIKFI